MTNAAERLREKLARLEKDGHLGGDAAEPAAEPKAPEKGAQPADDAKPDKPEKKKTPSKPAAPTDWTEDTHRKATIALFASVVVTALLYVIPYGHLIGYPLVLVSTVAHELGHGIAAQIVGGTFVKLEVFSDGSGVATSMGVAGRFGRAFMAAGGLCGPAVVAAFGFVLGRRQRTSRITLIVTGVLLVGLEIWVVRSAFGLFFIAVLAALCLGTGLRAPPWVSQLVLLLLSVQLALSVFSRGDYLFTDVARLASGPQPSDVSLMSDALFLPYWFWGIVCGAFSIVVLGIGLWIFVRGGKA
ncbi:MAG: M50 family metallopeptidase, partial [Deltaproteobacteria bacterium]|nr:M50 family metallopeptidase [Deltaproteobacteria bacterium]